MSDEIPYFTSTTKWFTQDGFKALFGRMASMLRRLEPILDQVNTHLKATGQDNSFLHDARRDPRCPPP